MSKKHKTKKRNYARNRLLSRRGNEIMNEDDGRYFLKLIVIVIASTCWVKLLTPIELGAVAINAFPLGSLIAAVFILSFEKWQFNRKIWYAVLVIVTIVSYFLPAGIII